MSTQLICGAWSRGSIILKGTPGVRNIRTAAIRASAGAGPDLFAAISGEGFSVNVPLPLQSFRQERGTGSMAKTQAARTPPSMRALPPGASRFHVLHAALRLKMRSKILPPDADDSLSASGGNICCRRTGQGPVLRDGQKLRQSPELQNIVCVLVIALCRIGTVLCGKTGLQCARSEEIWQKEA